uniref:Secreted protein n=1 Tax=Caenorhabditis tropicalis TaxID=1561998 RepID=A0A1I7UFF5_9PELO
MFHILSRIFLVIISSSEIKKSDTLKRKKPRKTMHFYWETAFRIVAIFFFRNISNGFFNISLVFYFGMTSGDCLGIHRS